MILTIIDSSLDKLFLLAGILLTLLAFDPLRYQHKTWDFCLKPFPNFFLFAPGVILLGVLSLVAMLGATLSPVPRRRRSTVELYNYNLTPFIPFQ